MGYMQCLCNIEWDSNGMHERQVFGMQVYKNKIKIYWVNRCARKLLFNHTMKMKKNQRLNYFFRYGQVSDRLQSLFFLSSTLADIQKIMCMQQAHKLTKLSFSVRHIFIYMPFFMSQKCRYMQVGKIGFCKLILFKQRG